MIEFIIITLNIATIVLLILNLKEAEKILQYFNNGGKAQMATATKKPASKKMPIKPTKKK